MNVWNGLDAFPTGREPMAATIGNFDGIHLGHQAILASVTGAAKARGIPSLCVTFDPHPLAVVAPSRRPKLLMTRRQKIDAVEACGVDGLLILPFDRELAGLDGPAFFDLLGGRIRFASVHVGRNFRFGHLRASDLHALEAIGSRSGFAVVGVAPLEVEGETVSSTAVRTAVEEGDVARARAMLGRPFEVTGIVVRGEGRGRRLRFPTANVAFENELVPRRGVYVTDTVAFATRFPSVTNVGVRPTFDGTTVTVEAHLLDVDEDLYGARVDVRFLARLRDEMRFEGPGQLADQIARDAAAATSYFAGLSVTRNPAPRLDRAGGAS
jgi:riboflavin kinase/FMN adenylyltransferase